MSQWSRPLPLAVTPHIGVVGPTDLVADVLAIGKANATGDAVWKAFAYDSEDRMLAAAKRAAAESEVLLFTGPVPHDRARDAGLVTLPAVFLSLNEEALHRALLAVAVHSAQSVATLSIDTLAADAVRGVYAELGVADDGLRLHPYLADDPDQDVDSLVGFHTATDGMALTCRREVEERLVELGRPVVRVVPTRQAVLSAVDTAVLLAGGAVARSAQLAMCVVGVDRFDSLHRGAASAHQLRELSGELHRIVLRQSRPLAATVVPTGLNTVLMITTLGALLHAEHEVEAIVSQASRQVGMDVSVGIGTGRSAHRAEDAAHRALAAAQQRGGSIVMINADAVEAAPATGAPVPRPETTSARDHRRLLEALRANGSDSLVVDSATAAAALGIADRSARRLLTGLAKDGLAWPVANPGADRGRPRQRFRLAAPED